MKALESKSFPHSINVPEELKKSILSVESESILREISVATKLNKKEEEAFFELCHSMLFSFSNTSSFIKTLEKKAGIHREKAKKLAQLFREKLLGRIVEGLNNYGININLDSENTFFEDEKLKVTDKYIYYSSTDSPQPIYNVSGIECHKNFLSSKHTVFFEVFIPEKGRWGTVDRPSYLASKKQAFSFKDTLEKAITIGKFRSMYENIENPI
jgi:hypothetical protein